MNASDTIFPALFRTALLTIYFFILASCDRDASHAAERPLTLTIISPHGSDIRREFADAFSAWHVAHFGTPVAIEWPDVGGGGTGNIVRTLDAAYGHGPSSGDDIIFGGGSAAFNTFGSKGYLVPVPALGDTSVWQSDPLTAVPADIFGSPLHGKDNTWTAATMSAFGMVINKDRMAELRLPAPRTWEDISRPAWFGTLSLADPSKSGSVKTSFEMIFQQYGWEKGWAIITELFANAAMVRDNGGAPGEDVGSADAIAGIVIDFYGRLSVVRTGPRVVGFVVPEGGTSLDADPIALLKGAPHPELAAQFIRFVVSAEGQKIWVLKAGAPGGPRRSALGRLSVVEDLYKTDRANLFDPQNPWDAGAASPLNYNAGAGKVRNAYIGDLIKAALIDNHAALVRARRAIAAAGDPPALLAALEALPSYKPAHVEHDVLTYGDVTTITKADQADVAAELVSPGAADPDYPNERIANDLKDYWRTDFAKRFAEVKRLSVEAVER